MTSCVRHTKAKIGLLSPYTGGNLGDAAIQDALIANIKMRLPNARIIGIFLNPRKAEERHKIPCQPISAIPIHGYWLSQDNIGNAKKVSFHQPDVQKEPKKRLFLKICSKLYPIKIELSHIQHVYQICQDLDYLVIAGGGQLDEFWGGPFGHPYSLFKWVVLAKLAQTRVWFLSVGLGSLRSPVSKLFIRIALLLADYRSFRDDVTRKQVSECLSRKLSYVYPDLAYSRPNLLKPSVETLRRTKLVAISPIAYCDPVYWPKKNAERYNGYLQKMALFLTWLHKAEYRTIFFTTDTPDLKTVRDIKDHLSRMNIDVNGRIAEPNTSNVAELINTIKDSDVVVASRMHSILLAHLAHKPVLAISYDVKVDTLMRDMNQSEYCLDINDLNTETLIAKFVQMQEGRMDIIRTITKQISKLQTLADNQYEMIMSRIH